MSIPAVPNYLSKAADQAGAVSPAMRFGLLLPIWTDRAEQEAQVRKRAEARSPEGREASELLARGMDYAVHTLQRGSRNPLPGLWQKSNAINAWNNVLKIEPEQQANLQALHQRQQGMANALPSVISMPANSLAPFTTGLGNEHPLENGFAFLNPYGIPYLAGSGVKGVLRRAAQELASGQWSEHGGWTALGEFPLAYQAGRENRRLRLSAIDVLFGCEPVDGDSDHVRGVLSFWDVFPQAQKLALDIMTPHQSHYYQATSSPHDSGQPNPILFLTIPPGTRFEFFTHCQQQRLQRIAPALATNDASGKPLWESLLRAAFLHAFTWLGFGAKTAVGYGAMAHDADAELRARRAREQQAAAQAEREQAIREQAQRDAQLAALSPVERSIQTFLDQRSDRQQAETSAIIGEVKKGRWNDEERGQVALWLKQRLIDEKQWKESSQAKKPDKDRAYQNTLLVKSWLP